MGMGTKKSVIILTCGLSGSSVLTGLIARAGYWTGEKTFKKPDYDTFENSRLIELNLKLFGEVKYEGNYTFEFPASAIKEIGCLDSRMDCAEYRAFINQCQEHQPWIWKDPRLWITIRLWQRFLDPGDCRYILLTRGSMQSWISSLLRRRIITYGSLKKYELRINDSIREFLTANKLEHLHVEYEELIVNPTETIAALNGFLGTELSINDLGKVYQGSLYKSPRSSWAKHVKAMLIYLKNYSERLEIAVE
jgi:hypothetical protein